MNMQYQSRFYVWAKYLLFTITLVVIDQATKYLAIRYLTKHDYTVFPGLRFLLSYNRGISFGLFHAWQLPAYVTIVVLNIAIIVGLACYARSRALAGYPIWAELLIFAGALSNVLDRLMRGAVVDFIDLFIGTWHWHTFNVADLCIVLGAFLFMICHVRDVR